MSKTLVIVESPGKIKKIGSYLGKDYIVKASYGHVRDLDPKNISIDIENNFTPIYKISKGKGKVVKELKEAQKKCKDVILAADDDREGEAIAASIAAVLKLKNPKRIIFNEITKAALQKAIKSPTTINYDMVHAQETRRILDRLVGYEISPILWRHLSFNLSAGRVQSVGVRLVVEREKDIQKFSEESYFKVTADFLLEETSFSSVMFKLDEKKYEKDNTILCGKVARLESKNDVLSLFKAFKTAKFIVYGTHTKKSQRNPPTPFITASLQQEASNKLGFTVKKTMSVAQKLYEAGHITYMRTDSVNLSKEALNAIKQVVLDKFGKKYYRYKVYSNKTKNAQEAHEAIRPTHVERESVSEPDQNRLYQLIWKRTVASQMSPAEIETTYIQIKVVHNKKMVFYFFETSIENIIFDGYLKIYNVDTSTNKIPKVEKGDKLDADKIVAQEEYTKPTARYTEASLVKKLKDLGIGRPSTYASIISKIQERGYVQKGDVPGEKKKVETITLKSGKVTSKNKEVVVGKEKRKMIPTEMGFLVTDFLEEHFEDIMDYKFTAQMENKLDAIVDGKRTWYKVLKKFYNKFHPTVDKLMQEKKEKLLSNDRILGEHPETGVTIVATIAKYGPVVRMGTPGSKNVKYAPIKKPQTKDKITLAEAVTLLKYPYTLGRYQGHEITVHIGKYGHYLKSNGRTYPLSSETVTLDEAKRIISEKDKTLITIVESKGKSYQVREGKYGPYFSYKVGKQFKYVNIPKDIEPIEITPEQVEELMKKHRNQKPKRARKI